MGRNTPKGYEKAIETITIEEIIAKTEAILSDLTEEKSIKTDEIYEKILLHLSL